MTYGLAQGIGSDMSKQAYEPNYMVDKATWEHIPPSPRQAGDLGIEPPKLLYDSAHLLGEVCQGYYDQRAGHWLSAAEKYVEGGGNICVLVKDAPVGSVDREPRMKALVFERDASKRIVGGHFRRGGVDALDVEVLKEGKGRDRRDELVFVSDAQFVESEQLCVPSLVRACLADYFDDLWSGEMYLSVTDARFKTVLITGEWKLDAVGVRRIVGRDERPDQVIQCGTKVMHGVADNRAEVRWDGFVCFKKEGSLAGLGLLCDNNSPVHGKERNGLSVEIVDVMFGAGYLSIC